MRWSSAILISCLLLIPRGLHAQDDLTGEQVRNAIDSGIKFLLSEQDDRSGRWQEFANYRGGVTALCTLALLNAGVNPDDPRMVKALTSLDDERFVVDKNYVTSLRIMAFAAADPKKYLTTIQRLADRLIERQYSATESGAGGWTYDQKGSSSPDASNSQFALLALHEARLAGAVVPPEVWRNARTYWLSLRNPGTGGFIYWHGGGVRPSGSMTCAGIASLIIIEENLRQLENGGMIQCCGEKSGDEMIDQAFQWLDVHWTTRGNPYDAGGAGRITFQPAQLYYYLYSIERAGRLSGRRFVGENRDWYREIAKFLVEERLNFGGWRGFNRHGEHMPEIATSFALLFLSKGLRPVVIGKYKHGSSNDWDRHAKGIHYLTRELELQWKQKLNWQTINGNAATTNELLQAPVLFFSGRDNLSFDQQQKDRLKEFVENGGFIFAEACQGDGCGDATGFDRKFRQLMSELFPNSELQVLPESHPIWTAQFKLLPNPDRPLLALQTSCRTAVIYCPANLSCLWEYNQTGVAGKLMDTEREKVEYAVRLGVNVVTYATNRELKQKLDSAKVIDSAEMTGLTRVWQMPKLAHGGGADDAPNAWNNILNRAKFDLKLKIKLEKDLIQPTTEQLQEYTIIFMHGRSRFTFSEAERNDLKNWIEGGGTFLFADSICGSTAFADAFRDEIKQMFPDGKWQDIPADHEIWSEKYDGYDIGQVTLREPIRDQTGLQFREQTVPPQMEGLFIDGRIVVVLSKYDLSCAMESATASQCKGYLKQDAAKIGVNVLLYAMQ